MKAGASVRERAAAAANVAAAWRRYARHRGLWTPGCPMSTVRREPVGPALALADDLRNGRFVPHPPTTIPVRKADGGVRTIAVYPLRDRVAQRAVLQVLQEMTDPRMAPLSFGFRPGRGVAGALAAAGEWIDRGHWWIMDADIERCFDSIPRQRVLDEVLSRTADADAAELVAQCMGWTSAAERAGRGVPQGSCLGPWLCNVYLWGLDDAAAGAGFPLVRYADDFVALLPTLAAARSAWHAVVGVLDGLRLRLHPAKSRIEHAMRPLPFLGGLIGGVRRLPAPAAAC